MQQVEFEPLGRTAISLDHETILDAARRAGAPIGNACGGTGVCGRCRVRIVAVGPSLSPLTSMERRPARPPLEPDERLACQAIVLGNCRVTTSYWGPGK
jgi:ferredoxin